MQQKCTSKRELERLLSQHGWTPRKNGKHVVYTKEGNPRSLAIQRGSKKFSMMIAKRLLKEAGIWK